MSWGGKRRAEKKEGARALVWIDVWAWADVPAAGQSGARSQAGVPAGGEGGGRARGHQPPAPASAAWHQVPPLPSNPPWASVGPCQSGAGAGAWGPPPHAPLPGCATQDRPLSPSGSWRPRSGKWGCWGREAILAFWRWWCALPRSGSVLLSLGWSGDACTPDTWPSTAPSDSVQHLLG